ncbi:MAG: hypothetical protein ACHREM_30355, partial [Polyangiales bacterium]
RAVLLVHVQHQPVRAWLRRLLVGRLGIVLRGSAEGVAEGDPAETLETELPQAISYTDEKGVRSRLHAGRASADVLTSGQYPSN